MANTTACGLFILAEKVNALTFELGQSSGAGHREVTEYLKLAEKTAYRHAADGKIPGFKFGGTWRFRRGDTDKWIDRQSAEQDKQGDR